MDDPYNKIQLQTRTRQEDKKKKVVVSDVSKCEERDQEHMFSLLRSHQ